MLRGVGASYYNSVDKPAGQPHAGSQDFCFGTLTHGFSIEDESPGFSLTVPPA
jgi:hypothetical protein